MRRNYSDEDIARAVSSSRSIAQALTKLGLRPVGGNYATLHRHIRKLKLSTSHMTGQGWSKGVVNPGKVQPTPLELILVEDSYFRTSTLRERLISEGLKAHRCEFCGRGEWNGRPIPLELDHKNGLRTDNRFENLRLLCPNCHAQTVTYRGRNIGKARAPVVQRAETGNLKFPQCGFESHRGHFQQCRLFDHNGLPSRRKVP